MHGAWCMVLGFEDEFLHVVWETGGQETILARQVPRALAT